MAQEEQGGIIHHLYQASNKLQHLREIFSPANPSVKSDILRSLFECLSPQLDEINGDIIVVIDRIKGSPFKKANPESSQNSITKILAFPAHGPMHSRQSKGAQL